MAVLTPVMMGGHAQRQQSQSKGHSAVSPPLPMPNSSGLKMGRPSSSYLQLNQQGNRGSGCHRDIIEGLCSTRIAEALLKQ